MRNDRRPRTGRGVRGLAAGMAALLGIIALMGLRANAQEPDGAGIIVSGKATERDVGLPFYPGATPHKDDKDDSDAARLGLWGGGFGFKLALVKMESNDAPGKVAAFYKKALAKYGTVLDCTNGEKADSGTDSSSKSLTCRDDKPDKGGMLLKAGTEKKQHLVAIQPNGTGSLFSWSTSGTRASSSRAERQD